MTTPLQPRGTLRARFEPHNGADMFRRLGVGARSCDLGDEGLYLAEELVAADRWFGGNDPLTLGVLVLALMIAQRQGSTCLPLDPTAKGHLLPLVTEICRLAGLLFVFVRHGVVVPVPVTDDTVATWADWLTRIVDRPEAHA